MYNNPYTESKTLRDLNLYVKDAYTVHTVDDLVKKISLRGKAKDLLITGDGGSGKTSLLTYVQHISKDNNVFVLYMFLGASVRNMNTLEFFEWIEESIIEKVRDEYDINSFQRWKKMQERLSSLQISLGPLSINMDSSTQPSSRNYISKKLPDDFSELAKEVKAKTGTKGILLLLDDADEISAAIFENFRTVFPDNGEFTLIVVSGRKLFMAGENMTLDEYNKRLLRPFDRLPIRPLKLHQTKEILMAPVLKVSANLWYEEAHIEIIHRMADGNPYIAYSIGELCFDYGLSGTQIRLTKHIAQIAEDRIWGVEDNMDKDQDLRSIISSELDPR